jgi:hypothetical protein
MSVYEFADIDPDWPVAKKRGRLCVIEYCKQWLRAPSPQQVEAFITVMARNPRYKLTEFEVRCLRRLNIFQALLANMPEKHYPDALHLWTAEENGLDRYLMIDKPFKTNVSKHKQPVLHCEVVWPEELVREFGITELDPYPATAE